MRRDACPGGHQFAQEEQPVCAHGEQGVLQKLERSLVGDPNLFFLRLPGGAGWRR